ncbi:hypothetical protein AGABI2DRAFT_177395, partial [Agaricus bisporus var. bisporus H97]|uniref:hypothetical protein n=1 Tax=Agaricus bisporus var. bisporus (strain H97 / ATCC MYA-4626 / FGSC 10389) TaxID=936046 RepID=UPI00029F6E41
MDEESTSSQHHILIIVFDVFVLLGLIMFVCTLLPAILSKTVQRSVAWYSLMLAWLTFSLSYGLLVGRQEGEEPPRTLCLVQALLIYGVPALVATGMLCYYIEFFLIIINLGSGQPRRSNSPSVRFLLVAMPWIVFVAIIIEVLLLIYVRDRLSALERSVTGFYCHLGDNLPNQISAGVVGFCMLVLIPLEGYTGYLIFRNRSVFQSLDKKDRHFFFTIYIRLILCTFAAILAFTLSLIALTPRSPNAKTLVYPTRTNLKLTRISHSFTLPRTVPIFIALAFGTQEDILHAWLFWRQSPQPTNSIVVNQNGTGNATVSLTTVIRTSIDETATTLSSFNNGHSNA